jgi:glycogen synthase
MTRVALLPSAYLPTLGGVQELSRHLAIALRAAGNEVEVWCQQDDAVDSTTVDELDGLVVRRFPFPLPRADIRSVARTGRAARRSLNEMRRAVRGFRPDLLHVQCFGPNGAYATALSAVTGTPMVITLQGETVMDDHNIFERSTTLRAALRFGLGRAAAVTACSAFTLRDAESRFGLQRGRGTVIFNGVTLGQTAASPPPIRSSPYVLALGRVVPNKGFDLLLRAFAQLRGHEDLCLIVGGDGAQLPDLRRLATELSLGDRVHFSGRLSREQVAALMANAQIFVMPSRLEPFGIVILEAWRARCPVIATIRGGPGEFVDDGRTGLLVDSLEPTQITAALAKLLADGALRDQLRQGGSARVLDFDWPTIADQYEARYAEVLSSGHSISGP